MKKILILGSLLLSITVQAKLVVGTTTQDLASIVKIVGGDFVDTFFVVKGTQDPHQIEAKPSYMIKFRNADLVIAQGLELESAWLTPLIQGARNNKITEGSKGYLELGPELDPIEIPKANATRAEGDVHPGGNPHFQLDPIRLGKAAVIISSRLQELDPEHKSFFQKSALDFQKLMNEKTKEWQTRIQNSHIKEVVTYHKTLSYFLSRFGVESTLQLEPKPGIPPTAGHIIEVIRQMKARKIKLVLIENYFDSGVRTKIENEIPDVKIAIVPVSVGGEDKVPSNMDLLERLTSVFEGVK